MNIRKDDFNRYNIAGGMISQLDGKFHCYDSTISITPHLKKRQPTVRDDKENMNFNLEE
jgi:hypothetical protein